MASLSLHQSWHKIRDEPRATRSGDIVPDSGCDPRGGSMDRNTDASVPPGDDALERARQGIARVVLAAGLVLLGLWILHRYLAALAWAAVLAIALWPLYRRLVSALGGHGQRILAPLILTLSIGFIFIVPFVYAAVEVARETHIFVQYLVDARRSGIPVPDWVPQLPGVGYPLEGGGRSNFSDPRAAEDSLGGT